MVLFISFNIFFRMCCGHGARFSTRFFFFFFGLAQVRFLLFPTVKVHQEGLARIIDFLAERLRSGSSWGGRKTPKP